MSSSSNTLTLPRIQPQGRNLGLRVWRGSQVLSRSGSLDLVLGAAFAIFSLALSLTHPWSHAYVGSMQYGDAAYWDFNGESWARGYAASKAPDIRPGYSVFLGVIYSLTGTDFSHAFVGQALLLAASSVMVYVIGKRLAGRLTGVLAAALFTLDPYIWEWTATSTTELLGAFFNLAGVYYLVDAVRGGRRLRSAGLFGLFLALSNIVRPLTLPFVVPGLLLVLFARGRWRAKAAMIAVGLAATVIGLLPGLVYQYWSTGDLSLSSNSAANLYGASSPIYKTWTPAMYDDVAASLTARSIATTPQNMDREFTRLTIQNYLQYPGFQVQRIASAFVNYGYFEGELERPAEYTFFRSPILIVFTLGVALLALARRRRPSLRVAMPAAILAAGFVAIRSAAILLGALQGLGVLVALVRSRQLSRRGLATLAVAGYWVSFGLLAILTTGIEGFFLNRLYTQVEPARALLLAIGATWLMVVLAPSRRGALRLLTLRGLELGMPRLPGSLRLGPRLLAVAVVAFVVLGLAKLTAANVQAADSAVFQLPNADLLDQIRVRMGLAQVPELIADEAAFDRAHTLLVSGALPEGQHTYAIPGQFSRFLWYLQDEDRTAFWYIFARGARPASLDRYLLTGEVLRNLPVAAVRDRSGLLIVEQTSAYFDAIGDVTQQNLVQVRGWLPWDDRLHSFNLDQATIFDVGTPLYDHTRFLAADKQGQVGEMGVVRVSQGDRPARALTLQTTQPNSQGQSVASITYSNVWIPAGATFHGWIALHPRLFGHAGVGLTTIEMRVRSGGRDEVAATITLDPLNPQQQVYMPFDADLSGFAGQPADLTMRVVGQPGATEPAEVLIGEPRVVQLAPAP